MKKTLFTLLILFCTLFFSACGKENNQNNNRRENLPQDEGENKSGQNKGGKKQNGADDSAQNVNQPETTNPTSNFNPEEAIVYYDTDTVNLLCSGENGTIYTYNRKGKKFCEYNTSGECVKEYPVDAREVEAFSYQDGTFYYIASPKLYAMDLETGTSEELYTFDGNRFRFGRMVALKDSIFIIRLEQHNEEWADVRFDDTDGYAYEGEELLCFHPSTMEMEKPNIPNIKQINRKNNQELLVYAYDEEGGFYFTIYHTDGTIEEKRYTGVKFGNVIDIAYDEDFARVICEDFNGVFLTQLDDLSGKAYAYEESSVGFHTLTCADGFTYDLFTVERKGRLVRLENRRLVRDTPTLKGYTLSIFYDPKGYGYPINCEQVTEEEIAMALLAGDSDYDFLILDTSHQIATDIRRTGAYYPLNSMDGLDALLNDSHPYVREAATAENGDLWMLPLDVECPVLLYNENMLEKYGTGLSQFSTYTELVDWTIKLPDDGSILYHIPYILMTMDITNQYLGNYAIEGNQADFHKEIFREYLEFMRRVDERASKNDAAFNSRAAYPYVASMEEYYKNLLFVMPRSTITDGGFYYERYKYIHALPVPTLREGERFKNQAQAFLVVVNPNSKRLQWVLEYLDEVCEGIREDEKSLMLHTNDFTGKPIWQELQAILADAEIYFEYPYEIIADEIYRYRREGKSYEDTVNEMERKMNMYLNE